MGVLVMTLIVFLLGGAVLAIKLRPEPLPASSAQRNLIAWQDAVEADPKSDTAHTGLGIAYVQLGRTSDARGEFVQALRINPRNNVALYQLGLLVKPSDPERAVELLEQAARYSPDGEKAAPLVIEGDVLMSLEDYEGARGAYARAITDFPYLFDAHFGLGSALEALGETKGAIREYKEAARFDPGNQQVADAVARLQGND